MPEETQGQIEPEQELVLAIYGRERFNWDGWTEGPTTEDEFSNQVL